MSTPALDIRGKVMAAKIFSPDKNAWADLSVKPGSDQNAIHIPYLSEIAIKEQISGFGEAKLTLTPPTYKESLELLESPFLFIGNTVGVRFGYTSGGTSFISPWTWYLSLLPEISFGDEFSITIPTTSFGFFPSMLQSKNVWNSGLQDSDGNGGTVPKITIKEVIETLAGIYNFELNWNGEGKNYSDAESSFSPFAIEIFKNEKITITQHGLNDWMFLKHIAAKAGCRAFISSGTVLNIVDSRKADSSTATFSYRGQIDFLNNVYPLEKFDGESSALFFPRLGVDSRYFQLDSKRSEQTQKVSASSSTTVTGVSGSSVPSNSQGGPKVKAPDGTTVPVPGFADKSFSSDYIPVASRDNLAKTKLSNYMAKSTAENHGASAKITAIDIPWIMPEDIVKIVGLGKYYSVSYRIFEIERKYGNDFAESTYSLKPKGFPDNIANWLKARAQIDKSNLPSKKEAKQATKNAQSGEFA